MILLRVVCRADASHFLGAGHVMRLLALALAIRDNGGDVLFLCREHPGNLAKMIRSHSFKCHLWPCISNDILGASVAEDAYATQLAAKDFGADWIFVDHYGTDAHWEASQILPVLAIEDLLDREHACNILLNQNLGVTKADYVCSASGQTTYLIGPKYALLRSEFSNFRRKNLSNVRNSKVSEILLTMGGTDQPNATGWVLECMGNMDIALDFHLTIVMGHTAPHLYAIKRQAALLPFRTTVLAGTSNMATLMAQADFAIGAAGSTAWERCALGLPSIVVTLADNQQAIASALQQLGASISIDMKHSKALKKALRKLLEDAELRFIMAKKAFEIVDGQGVKRVLSTLQTVRK